MLDHDRLLASLPTGLRTELLTCYQAIVRNYAQSRWEPAELNGGKFCEVVYTILDGATSGSFSSSAAKPPNLVDACRAIEGRVAAPARVGDRSLRILISRVLPFLYEIRNNRGVGHVGGDVSPSREDAEVVLAVSSWIMAELIRIFHSVTLSEAQLAVDSTVQRRHPLVWGHGSIKRVLNPKLSKGNQVLVLLYSEPGWVEVKTLHAWIEYSSLSTFRGQVLKKLRGRRLCEYDTSNDKVCLTPNGLKLVESSLLADKPIL